MCTFEEEYRKLEPNRNLFQNAESQISSSCSTKIVRPIPNAIHDHCALHASVLLTVPCRADSRRLVSFAFSEAHFFPLPLGYSPTLASLSPSQLFSRRTIPLFPSSPASFCPIPDPKPKTKSPPKHAHSPANFKFPSLLINKFCGFKSL